MNVGLIGVGKLGLAYALLFERSGHRVWASSYKEDYVRRLQAKKSDSHEPGVQALLESSNINFTTNNHDVIDHCDVIYVLVATPSNPAGDYDVSAVHQVAHDLMTHDQSVKNKTLIIGSTVNPGTSERLQTLLHEKQVRVAYCPTFSAQGSVLHDIQNPYTFAVGTTDTEVANICKEIFGSMMAPHTPIHVMHPRTIEIMKLAGNCRATMEITFFNTIGRLLLCQGLEQDLDQAMIYLNGVKKGTMWGFGFGYGGPCYPRDNRSLVHFASGQGMTYPLGRLLDQLNQEHGDWLVEWLLDNNRNDLAYYFEYISYKKDVAIFEESQQLAVCKKLLDLGKRVYIEPSQFLPMALVQELEAEYGDLIQFVNQATLTDRNTEFFNVIAHI